MTRKRNGDDETAVATTEETAVMQPDVASAMMEDAGAGDEFSSDDLSVPFISILQKGSPQVEEDGIEGASAGMFYNTVTNALFDGKKGIDVVYCAYSKIGVEWVPREQGGGLVAHHQLTEKFRQSLVRQPDSFRLSMPNGNSLVETAYHYVLHLNEGVPEMAVVSMWSTALKTSRQWNTQAKLLTIPVNGKMIRPPIYSQIWRLKTTLLSKDNYKWYGYTLERVGQVPSIEVYNAAKAYREAVTSGIVKVSAPPSPEEAGAHATEGTQVTDDGTPF